MQDLELQAVNIAHDAKKLHHSFYWSSEYRSAIFMNPDTLVVEILPLKKARKVFLLLMQEELTIDSSDYVYCKYKSALTTLGLRRSFQRLVFLNRLKIISALIFASLLPILTLFYFLTNPTSILFGLSIFLLCCLISGAVYSWILGQRL